MSTYPIRWGIAGPGHIAKTFAAGLAKTSGGLLVAVASTSLERAAAFSKDTNLPLRCYGSYAELANDPDVDAVYVSTLHPFHAPTALIFLKAGKAVLCEKPLAMNAGQVRELTDTARRNQVFLMEGLWSRFLPAMRQVCRWLDEKRIGELISVQAQFGVRFPAEPDSRIYAKKLGGGALLDLGVYPISILQMIFGRAPVSVQGQASIGETGVDEVFSATLGFGGRQFGYIAGSLLCALDNTLRIYGSDGQIIVPDYWAAVRAELVTYARPGQPAGSQTEVWQAETTAGFENEIAAAMDCMLAGELECPLMSWADSLIVAHTMDKLRRDWNFRYDGE